MTDAECWISLCGTFGIASQCLRYHYVMPLVSLRGSQFRFESDFVAFLELMLL